MAWKNDEFEDRGSPSPCTILVHMYSMLRAEVEPRYSAYAQCE